MYSTETDTLFNHHLTQNFQLSLKYSMYVDNCMLLIKKASVPQSTMQAFIEVMKSRLEATRLN